MSGPFGWFASPNPSLQEVCDEVFDEHAPEAAFAGRDLDWSLLDHYETAITSTVRQECYQLALELVDELEHKRGPGILERARVRQSLALYLRHEVAPWARRNREPDTLEYLELADRLEHARPWGVYGIDPYDDSLVTEWANRAGLVKLCPDDAREEAARVSAKYVPMLEALQEAGFEVQFAVFTIPNVPRWHLGAGMDAIFSRFRNEILYARTDGRIARSIDDPKRRFPELRGALAVLEAPLSASGDWNVHLNVIMVFDRRPDWRDYREAWAANVEFRRVPTGASSAALRELVKYPLKAIAQKSAEKARPRRDKRTGRVLEAAPPTIQWAPDAFVEWWRAHKGFRRTRSWGCLYAGNVPDAPERSRDKVEWLGKVTLRPWGLRVSRPVWDASVMESLGAARARARGVDLILGNKSAGFSGSSGPGPPVQ